MCYEIALPSSHNFIMDYPALPSSSTSHGFTPVRRREETVNTKQLHGDPEKEWTAARCHRLLRALTSRVAILTKEIARYSTAVPVQHDLSRAKKGKRKSAGHLAKDDDEEWTKVKKRVKKTYSNRGGRGSNRENTRGSGGRSPAKSRMSHIPGEISIPTPILVRARGDYNPEDNVPIMPALNEGSKPKRGRGRPRLPEIEAEGQFRLSDTMRGMRQKLTATKYTTYEGVYAGLEALLRVTADEMPKSRPKGARSLLMMALKNVPKYISHQEALLQAYIVGTGSKSAIQDRDISTEVYDDLETFGCQAQGWKQLRIIVRSHGIQVVSDAMEAGLFDLDFSGALIALCVNMSFVDEAQILFSALLSSTSCPEPKSLYDTAGRVLSMLWKFTEFTGKLSFQYRHLTRMILSGQLPPEWLATKEFGSIWTKAIQSLSPGSINSEALAFLDTALPMLSVAGNVSSEWRAASTAASKTIIDAAKNTVSSIVTTLTSIVILSREAAAPCDQEAQATPHRYNFVSRLLKSYLVQSGICNSSSNPQDIYLLLANLIAQQSVYLDVSSTNLLIDLVLDQINQEIGGHARAAAAYNEASMFLSLVARCCGRGTLSQGLEHLQILHLLLETVVCDADDASGLKGLIVDSAFAFAKNVPEVKHFEYATALDAKFGSCRLRNQATLSTTSADEVGEAVGGFRWEEGIGEWVTASPIMVKKIHSLLPAIGTMEDSSHSVSHPSPPRLRSQTMQSSTPMIYSSPLFLGSQHDNAFDQSMQRFSAYPREDNTDMETCGMKRLLYVQVDNSIFDPKRSPIMSRGLGAYFPGSNQTYKRTANFSRSPINTFKDSVTNASGDDSERLSSPSFISDESSQDFEDSLTEACTKSEQSPSSVISKTSRCGRRSIERAPSLRRKSFRQTKSWQLPNESLVSTCAARPSDNRDAQGARGDPANRKQRQSKRQLRSSQNWQDLEDSDDELGLLSISSHGDQALREIANLGTAKNTKRRQYMDARSRPRKAVTRRKWMSALDDSEDELCS